MSQRPTSKACVKPTLTKHPSFCGTATCWQIRVPLGDVRTTTREVLVAGHGTWTIDVVIRATSSVKHFETTRRPFSKLAAAWSPELVICGTTVAADLHRTKHVSYVQVVVLRFYPHGLDRVHHKLHNSSQYPSSL